MKSVLITGGTGDLGSAVVPRLIAGGYRCIAFYRRTREWERLRDKVNSENLAGLQADLADEDDVHSAVSRAVESGPIFGLVHLVGGFEMKKVEEATLDDWTRMLSANLTPAFLMARAVIPHLEPGGRIVAISSASTQKLVAGMGTYLVSKSALNTLAEVLAIELKDRKIEVNTILPTSLDTPTMRKQMDRSKLVPLERVAETILFLLSDAGANITGSRIVLSA
jgi:NAD(P)-dependent dehydrogenase (short-subunit alcohol dehydrogenase family)